MLPEISFFESILCFFVVMIHILSESIDAYAPGTVPSIVLFSVSRLLTFAVPGFVISAGIKFAHKFEYTQFRYLDFLKGRILKIFVPYVFCAVLYYLYFAFRHQYYEFSFAGLFGTIFEGSIAAPFYFIILIMQIYILSPVMFLFYKSFPSFLGITLALSITLVSMYFTKELAYNNRIFLNYFLYWTVGCYIGIDFRNKIAKLNSKKMPLLFLGIILTVFYVMFSYLQFLGVYISFANDIIKIAYCTVVPLTYLSYMPKTVGYFAEEFSTATFYVFLIHCLAIFEIQHILTAWNITSVPLRMTVEIIFTYTVSVLLSYGYVCLKKKIFGAKTDF